MNNDDEVKKVIGANQQQLERVISAGRAMLEKLSQKPDLWADAAQFRSAGEMLVMATIEVDRLQHELWAQFADVFGFPPCLAPKEMWSYPSRRTRLGDTAWCCTFHGVEVDFENTLDPRFLSIDMLSMGIIGITSIRGMSGFLQTSRSPWAEFPKLRDLLCVNGRPVFDRFISLGRNLVEQGQLVWLAGDCFALSEIRRRAYPMPGSQ